MHFEELKNNVFQKLKTELPEDLTYHGFHHTLYVYDAAVRIAEYEKVNGDDLKLLLTGVLLHDIGFINVYKDHEEESCKIAEQILPDFGYHNGHIDNIKSMIMRTKIPQVAFNKLEEIICDADLDYLGTDDFLPIGNQLFQEFLNYGIVKNEEDWNRLQIRFLTSHEYFTDFSKRFRAQAKMENLEFIKKIVENYETNKI